MRISETVHQDRTTTKNRFPNPNSFTSDMVSLTAKELPICSSYTGNHRAESHHDSHALSLLNLLRLPSESHFQSLGLQKNRNHKIAAFPFGTLQIVRFCFNNSEDKSKRHIFPRIQERYDFGGRDF